MLTIIDNKSHNIKKAIELLETNYKDQLQFIYNLIKQNQDSTDNFFRKDFLCIYHYFISILNQYWIEENITQKIEFSIVIQNIKVNINLNKCLIY